MRCITILILVMMGFGSILADPLWPENVEKGVKPNKNVTHESNIENQLTNALHQNGTFGFSAPYMNNTTTSVNPKVRKKRAIFTLGVGALIGWIVSQAGVLGATTAASVTVAGTASVAGSVATAATVVTVTSTTASLSAASIGAGAAVGSVITGAITGTIIAVNGMGNEDYKEYNRYFEMKLTNALRWKLKDPRAYTHYGYISKAPTPLSPCITGTMNGHKVGHTAQGTTGIISYRIEEQGGLNIIIYWSVVYSGCNHFGLAIYRDLPSSEPSGNNKHHYFRDFTRWHMDYVDHGSSLSKTIGFRNLCQGSEWWCTTNAGLKLCGIMTNNNGAKIDIVVSHDNDNVDQCKNRNLVNSLESGAQGASATGVSTASARMGSGYARRTRRPTAQLIYRPNSPQKWQLA